MKLLIIEDKVEYRDQMVADLETLSRMAISVATTRDEAFDILAASEYFDVVISDLKIPASAGKVPDTQHGVAVCERISQMFPGTPLLILSAFGTVQLMSEFMNSTTRADIFGTREDYPLKRFYTKEQLPECLATVREINDELKALGQIEISPGTSGLILSDMEKRVLRIFARRLGGRIVSLSPLGGGFSSAKTLRVSITDENGQAVTNVVAKLGRIKDINLEQNRYSLHVVSLGVGSFTARVDEVNAGAGALGGLFYTLAKTFDKSVFGVLRSSEAEAVEVVRGLIELCKPWRDGAPLTSVPICDIRADMITDESFEKTCHLINGVNWQQLESQEISVRRCRQHRDLHGENALVDAELRPVLIDYGEVDFGTASLDAITLEMSLIFHPEAADIRASWPSLEEAAAWADLDKYTEKCPVPSFVRACRDWAFDGSTAREVYATAYAYCCRQLKYADTDKELARAIIEGVAKAMAAT